MNWLTAIMIHGLVCLFAVIDAVAAPMTPRGRASWLVCIALLPAVGAVLYVLFGRRADIDDPGHGPDNNSPQSGD